MCVFARTSAVRVGMPPQACTRSSRRPALTRLGGGGLGDLAATLDLRAHGQAQAGVSTRPRCGLGSFCSVAARARARLPLRHHPLARHARVPLRAYLGRLLRASAPGAVAGKLGVHHGRRAPAACAASAPREHVGQQANGTLLGTPRACLLASFRSQVWGGSPTWKRCAWCKPAPAARSKTRNKPLGVTPPRAAIGAGAPDAGGGGAPSAGRTGGRRPRGPPGAARTAAAAAEPAS